MRSALINTATPAVGKIRDDHGLIDEIIRIAIGFGVLVIVLAIIFFRGQQFYNSL